MATLGVLAAVAGALFLFNAWRVRHGKKPILFCCLVPFKCGCCGLWDKKPETVEHQESDHMLRDVSIDTLDVEDGTQSTTGHFTIE
jgi:hypothetical protein